MDDLEEIEDFRAHLKICPECGSAAGFWLVAKADRTYFQCQHCAAIMEVCKVHPGSETKKDARRFLQKLRP